MISFSPAPEGEDKLVPVLPAEEERTLRTELLDRFLRYVRIWTTSDSSQAGIQVPSTARQTDFLKLLEQELVSLGFSDSSLYHNSFLVCRIPGTGSGGPVLGFMAHVDTSEDVSGKDVNPQIHIYRGAPLKLKEGVILSEDDDPSLARYRNEEVVTSDGTTLLGADDKSGVAALMTLAGFISRNKGWPRPDLELIFTTDEETGHGMDLFSPEMIRSRICYTIDGGEEGELEDECYHAALVTVRFSGRMVHPGYGRGKLVNALSLAAHFITLLPRSESPEATDDRYGNYWVHHCAGTMEEAVVQVMIRDFEEEGFVRRKKAVSLWAESAAAGFPGSGFTLESEDLYRNMKERIAQQPEVMGNLEQAVRMTGLEPVRRPIRGGTDGARLTSMGIPTPNIFTGGHNFHSRREWLAVPALVRTCQTLLNLAFLYSDK